MRRNALITAASVGGVLVSFAVWTAIASWAYASIAQVPQHCWFYYAVPWPDRFLWDGLDLIVSGAFGAVPFVLVARIYQARRRTGPAVYGRTRWADRKQMENGGIKGSSRLS